MDTHVRSIISPRKMTWENFSLYLDAKNTFGIVKFCLLRREFSTFFGRYFLKSGFICNANVNIHLLSRVQEMACSCSRKGIEKYFSFCFIHHVTTLNFPFASSESFTAFSIAAPFLCSSAIEAWLEFCSRIVSKLWDGDVRSSAVAMCFVPSHFLFSCLYISK
jgi:hypothetical protein